MLEYEEAQFWDKIRVEIDFNSDLAEFEVINARDFAKVAAIFSVLYTAESVANTISLCLELLAVFTFIHD